MVVVFFILGPFSLFPLLISFFEGSKRFRLAPDAIEVSRSDFIFNFKVFHFFGEFLLLLTEKLLFVEFWVPVCVSERFKDIGAQI